MRRKNPHEGARHKRKEAAALRRRARLENMTPERAKAREEYAMRQAVRGASAWAALLGRLDVR